MGRFLRHRAIRVAEYALILVLGGFAAAHAGDVTIPHVFVNGQASDANEVNANFSVVENAVDDNDARIDALDLADGAQQAEITSNTSAISTNQTNIASQSGAIATNAAGVASNASAIATNAAGVAANATLSQSNASQLGTNTTDIATNDGRLDQLETDLVNGSACPVGEFVVGVGANGDLACAEPNAVVFGASIGTLSSTALPTVLSVHAVTLSVSRSAGYDGTLGSFQLSRPQFTLALVVDTADGPTHAALQSLHHTPSAQTFTVTVPAAGVDARLDLTFDAEIQAISMGEALSLVMSLSDNFVFTAIPVGGAKGGAPVSVAWNLATGTGTGCGSLPVAYATAPTAGEVPIDSAGLTTSRSAQIVDQPLPSISGMPFEVSSSPCYASAAWGVNVASGATTTISSGDFEISLPEGIFGVAYSLDLREAGSTQALTTYAEIICRSYGAIGSGEFCWDYKENVPYP